MTNEWHGVRRVLYPGRGALPMIVARASVDSGVRVEGIKHYSSIYNSLPSESPLVSLRTNTIRRDRNEKLAQKLVPVADGVLVFMDHDNFYTRRIIHFAVHGEHGMQFVPEQHEPAAEIASTYKPILRISSLHPLEQRNIINAVAEFLIRHRVSTLLVYGDLAQCSRAAKRCIYDVMRAVFADIRNCFAPPEVIQID